MMGRRRLLAAAAGALVAIPTSGFIPTAPLGRGGPQWVRKWSTPHQRCATCDWAKLHARPGQGVICRVSRKIFGEEDEEEDVGIVGDEAFDDDIDVLVEDAEGDDEDDELDMDGGDEEEEQDDEEGREVRARLAEETLNEKKFAQQVLREFPDVPVVEVDRYGNRIGGADPFDGAEGGWATVSATETTGEEKVWPEVRGDPAGMDDPPDAPWRVEAERVIRERVASVGLNCYDIMWSYHKVEVTVTLTEVDEASEEAGYVDSELLMKAIRAVNAGLEEREPELWVLNRHELIIATPGAKDILTTEREFTAFKGFDVVVKTGGPFKNKRELTGRLMQRTFDELHISQKGRTIRIPLALVDEVRLPAAKYEPGDLAAP